MLCASPEHQREQHQAPSGDGQPAPGPPAAQAAPAHGADFHGDRTSSARPTSPCATTTGATGPLPTRNVSPPVSAAAGTSRRSARLVRRPAMPPARSAAPSRDCGAVGSKAAGGRRDAGPDGGTVDDRLRSGTGHRLLPARRPAHRRGARDPRPGPRVRRRRGHARSSTTTGSAAQFPFELVPKLAELGIVGGTIEGYGCPGLSRARRRAWSTLELARGDGSVNTFLGVQSGLAMGSINMLGSEEQKQRWLPAMARLDKIGAFALTEPDHGSDSVALETTARRDGDHWVLNGAQAVDRQRAPSPTSSSSGRATTTTARSRASSSRSDDDGDRTPTGYDRPS